MIKITYPGTNNFSSFVYDGEGKTASILETVSGSVTSTKQFVWAGRDKCELRDGSGAIVAQYFGSGEISSGSKYFYAQDHLGSVREVWGSALQAQFAYDAFGNVNVLSQSFPIDFQFAGYYLHARSGLSLTRTRAYSSHLGRWISRDPITESGGLNLYSYVGNSPNLFSDHSGLCVTAIYSQRQRILSVTDNETQKSVTCKDIFSGNGPYKDQWWADNLGGRGPLPTGSYTIDSEVPIPEYPDQSEFLLSPTFKTRRGGFTIHPGRRSNGCITIISDVGENDPGYPHNDCFDRLQALLSATKPCCGDCKGKLGKLTVTR